ncbi:MAG: Mur ligase family protein [bacterium]|nr:Mur ligase family protein [bacterium]
MLILSIVLYNTGHTTWYELLIGILIILMFFPFYLVTTNFLFFPIQITYEQYIIQKAKSKLKKHKELKVIGIVGSYGKTSQKEILQDVLSTKYEVLATVDNKNTLLSVAYRIIRCLQEKHQIFIVEM